jgi:hypothetical protein
MRCASVAGCVPGAIEALLHCGFADRAKEGPGQRSILYSLLSSPPRHDTRSIA